MSQSILLVEDSPSDAAIFMAALEDAGYTGRIQVASTGIEAIQALEKVSFDSSFSFPQLILLDLNLPKKSGLEVLEEIKQHPIWRSIPTIVLSSSSSPSDINRSYQLQANAYLAKPRELSQYQAIAQQLRSFWLETIELPNP